MIRFLFILIFLIINSNIASAQQLPAPTSGTATSPAANCIDRQCAYNEFNGNAAAINNLCGLTKVEVGLRSKDCAQMFIESVMNRAAALSKPGTCSNTVQSRLNDTPYWGAGSKRLSNTAAEHATCIEALNGALSGSNTCNYCTDNASAGLAQRRQAAGNPGVWCDFGGGKEFFYTNYNGSGSGGVPAHKAWRQREEGKNTGQACTPRNVEAPPNNTQNTPEGSSPPPASSPPVGFTPGNPTQIHFNNLSQALKAIWVATLQIMTSQLSAIMMEQTLAIGTFFDAKHQLESQRLMQEKLAQAHKDYQPSEQMCQVGTFVRNLANTEKRAELTKAAMAQSAINRELATGDVSTFDIVSDEKTKMTAYLDKFCSPDDNGQQNQLICNNKDKERMNADINYTQTIGAPLTIPLNMMDGTTKPEEENLFMLMDYLFMNNRSPWVSKTVINTRAFREPYQNMRSLTAMRSVAQNSFAHIIGEKTESPENSDESNAPFIKSLMKEMGVKDDEIERTIGKNPSYYAQMEVLTKKIYQDPKFIVNLYDKPTNVKRLKAAMTAIKLMQDRDIHNALMRREMLMSMLLELQLRQEQQDLLRGELNDVLESQPLPNNNNGNTQGTGQGF